MNDLLKTLSLAALLASVAGSLGAAGFDSGSDGSDGLLVFAPDLGDVVFDPDNYDPVLDPDRDGIYHFDGIVIGSGTTVVLRGDVLGHKPLVWLSSYDVQIDGDIHLGASGVNQDIPGVGGFEGGKSAEPSEGQGPGGGESSSPGEVNEIHINPFLIPLIGGSGSSAEPGSYNDGLAGGGAMLLASSGTIFWEGSAWGIGASMRSANIRLMANRFLGQGAINEFNVVRIEAFEIGFSGGMNANTVVKTRPGPVFPTHPIKITVIDSLPVDQTKPGANKDAPDVTINNGNEVTIKVECTGIPMNYHIEVIGWNDTVGRVDGSIDSASRDGTIEASEGTCTMVIPTGNTTFMARAYLGP